MNAGTVILQYVGYALEAAILAYILVGRREARLYAASGYLALLLAVDAFSRPYVLYRFGFNSFEYAYFFWLTDVMLALVAFLLVCLFFHRACSDNPELWRVVRLTLIFVLILVTGVSLFSLSRNVDHLFTRFIVSFQQNLYFSCLVLNTMLYLLMQQLESADEELQMLVCGLGIQFAGPAANFALVYLTPGHAYASSLYRYVGPLCTLGMLLTWLYALVAVRQPLPAWSKIRAKAAWATVPNRQV